MTEINFFVSKDIFESLSLEEYEAFERAQDGDVKLYQMRPVLARFMVDEKNKAVPHAQAMKVLGKLPVSKLRETMEKFMEAMKVSTVPNASGEPSSSPSEASPADSLSPAG
jgi:hypothetical protein